MDHRTALIQLATRSLGGPERPCLHPHLFKHPKRLVWYCASCQKEAPYTRLLEYPKALHSPALIRQLLDETVPEPEPDWADPRVERTIRRVANEEWFQGYQAPTISLLA